MSDRFLNALSNQNKDSLPVWFMRQAGRYLPEYRELRKLHDFRTMSHRPDLICEVTVQPLRRYPLDAAILFSDILTCLEYMGSGFHFGENGPTLERSGPEALDRLNELNPANMQFVFDGISLIRKEIGSRPLIGFVGAPFTLASYLVEGGTSREFQNTREMMLNSPEKFQKQLMFLAENVGRYLKQQVSAGVQAVQIFDSWVGILSLDQYRQIVLPSIQRMIEIVKQTGVPVILYSQPTRHLLPALVESGADALSVDWRTSLTTMAREMDALSDRRLTIQGNLDPLVTTLSWEKAKPHVDKILNEVEKAELRSRYIFNVGHGVVPETRPETISKIIDYVHAF